jgi:hypothetical protein
MAGLQSDKNHNFNTMKLKIITHEAVTGTTYSVENENEIRVFFGTLEECKKYIEENK